jgi:hypothetical protein
MKTQLIITVESPDSVSPHHFIDLAIKPYINDINADCMEGWGVSMVQSPRYTYEQLRQYALMVSIEHHLCQVDELVDDGKSADDILQMVAAGDDGIVIWEHYEYEDADDLVELIEDERGVNLYNFEHVLEQINGESWFAEFKGEK